MRYSWLFGTARGYLLIWVYACLPWSSPLFPLTLLHSVCFILNFFCLFIKEIQMFLFSYSKSRFLGKSIFHNYVIVYFSSYFSRCFCLPLSLTSRSPPARLHQPPLPYPFINLSISAFFPFFIFSLFCSSCHFTFTLPPPPPFFFQHLHPLFSPPIYYP